jgi:hypothetical protein
MSDIKIAATDRSPDVEFDFAAGTLVVRGESYPEDAAAIFGPIFAGLERFLAAMGPRPARVVFELAYFNSSSAKALMNMFLKMDQAAANGTPITIDWLFTADDDTMKEFGEDFSEDLEHVVFNLVSV